MKYIVINSVLVASLLFSSVAMSQSGSEVESDQTTELKERNKGDRDGDNKRRGDNDLSDRAIRRIDTDDDGQVSIDEYMAHAQQRFSDLDLDGNNFVTSDEAKEAAEIMRERQREARSSLEDRRNRDSESNTDSE